jgi:hypothetical protein
VLSSIDFICDIGAGDRISATEQPTKDSNLTHDSVTVGSSSKISHFAFSSNPVIVNRILALKKKVRIIN